MKHTTFKQITARLGILLLSITLLAFPLSLPAAAQEEAPTPVITSAAQENVAPTETGAASPEDTAEEGTLAGAIADFLREESAGILSGATLLLTLVISLGFRKRIIPSLLDALTALIGKSREAVGSMIEGREAEHAVLCALLDRVEGMLTEARTAACAAESAAATVLTGTEKSDALQRTLAEQSDLLYEILMSANLPQYQKDRIGAQHARVKAALSGEGHE